MGFILYPDHKVSQGLAVAILVLNILIPGTGTMLYGRIGRGILELLFFWVLFIPYIMGILDGVQILTKAVEKRPAKEAAKAE